MIPNESLTNEGLIGAGRDLQIGTDGDRIYSVTSHGNRALLAAGRDATVFADTIENTGQAAIYAGGDSADCLAVDSEPGRVSD